MSVSSRAKRGISPLAVLALFLAANALHAQAVDDPLARPLTLRLAGATVEQALRTIATTAAVRLSFSSDLLPASTRVTVDRERTTVGAALREVLRGTGLGTVVAGSGHVVVLRTPLAAESLDSGVTDSTPPVVRTAPQVMDRVLVMGTPVAGAPERELTTAVAVISAERIARDHPRDLNSLFRTTIPGVTAWDLGASGPVAQIGAIRGSSSFSANYLKSYFDGVELASPYLLFAIDPALVAQIEIIQGPQGSAMYGSDAISGVAHVISDKGTFGARGAPSVAVNTSGGVVETEYADRAAVAQHHTLGVRGGASLFSYSAGISHSDNGAYVAGSRAGSSTIVGATRALIGPLLFETSARAARIDFSAPVSPPLARVLGSRAVPLLARAAGGQVINEHTFGATAIYQPLDAWRHTLVVGFDRNYGALAPQRNPASVADVLLGVSEEDARRASLRYSTSLRLEPASALTTTFTLGLERSRLQRERSGPAAVIGTAPTRGNAIYVDTVDNTGAFGQIKLDIARTLYLSAGLRGEDNSSFGDGYGTAWSPMVGASYVSTRSLATTKLRAAFGKGIRPPPPSARRSLTTTQFRQMANPQLAPETQSGVEGGFDVFVGSALAVSMTAFDQRADGLIQHVIPNPRLSPKVVQQQNVGRISNRGGEGNATLDVAVARAEASVARVASTVQALSKTYSGDLRIGDQLPEVPEWSGHAAASFRVARIRATAGLTFLSGWTGYDWLSYYGALAQGAEPPTSMRVYWVRYPSTRRPYAMIARESDGPFNWFARVDNVTNEQRDARDNLQVLPGRTTTVGASIHFPRD